MTTFFLSRRQHDFLLDSANAVLKALFAKCNSRKWSLAGVTFKGLPEESVADANKALESLPPTPAPKPFRFI